MTWRLLFLIGLLLCPSTNLRYGSSNFVVVSVVSAFSYTMVQPHVPNSARIRRRCSFSSSVTLTKVRRWTSNTNAFLSRCPTLLSMGLYDTPLPPRPMPRNETSKQERIDEDDDENGDEDCERSNLQPILFSFNEDGTEVNGALPPLGRSLRYGVECYYEVTDRIVRNLIDKTDCHPTDAAWALEACKGDVTEAWTCISAARRQLLDTGIGGSSSLSSEVSELMAENEYEILKEERLENEKQKERQQKKTDYFSKGTPDAPWLPKQNPKPVDDEPWFTG